MVSLVGERGYGSVSVEAVSRRAHVSRRTFYALFDSVEDCFAAVLFDGLERTGAIIAEAFAREKTWEDGIRSALAGLLVCFDSEPLLARVWFIEALAAGSWALEHRERSVGVLRGVIVERWATLTGGGPAPAPDSPAVVGAMAAVIGAIHTHLITQRPEPLIVLLGPLVGLVSSPYLDPPATAREVARAEDCVHELLRSPYPPVVWPLADLNDSVEVPAPLRDPRAHRARMCLHYLLRDPGACNREIASGIGVSSHAQMSKLLSRLSALGLLVKVPGGPGLPNAWSLSEPGARVAHALEDGPRRESPVVRTAVTLRVTGLPSVTS